MRVYRIVQKAHRAHDLSGTGAYRFGGRWNSPGTYMLYTSENRSLAMLEVLVHFDQDLFPADMYVMEIEIDDSAPLHVFPERSLPENWRAHENISLKETGDTIMQQMKYAGIVVPSAVLPSERNVLLNPLFKGYQDLIKISAIELIQPDERLLKK